MNRRRPSDKPLSEPMMVRLLKHICVTGPQWVYLNVITCPHTIFDDGYPDNKVHVAHMGPTWVLSAPGRPNVGPMNFAIRVVSPMTTTLALWQLLVSFAHSIVTYGKQYHQNHTLECRNSHEIFSWYVCAIRQAQCWLHIYEHNDEILAHFSLNNWPKFCKNRFEMEFLEWNLFKNDYHFKWICSYLSNYQYHRTGIC